MRKALLALVLLLAAVTSAWAQAPVYSVGGVLQTAAVANGNGQTLDTSQLQVVTFQSTGSFVATINYEGSLDGVNWATLPCLSLDSTTGITQSTAPDFVRCNANGILRVRARISNYQSGTITVIANGSAGDLVRAKPTSIVSQAGLTRGSCQFPFLSKTCTVTFPTPTAAATYRVTASCSTPQAPAISYKAVNGFIMTVATAGQGFDTCDWTVIP